MGELNIVGGHLALDLVNTVEPRVPGGAGGNDHLETPDDLVGWSLRLALLTTAEAERVREAWAAADQGAEALDASIEVREATYEVLLAALDPARQAQRGLESLSRHWAAAVGRSSLTLTPMGVTWLEGADRDRLRVGDQPEWLIPDRLAHAAVDLLRTLDEHQLKTCPLDEGGCGWLFLDRSRNASRRWCSMTDCGARAKARRLTNRRRTARGAA